MNRDQLSTFKLTNLSGSPPADLNTIFLQPDARAAQPSARQRVLDRILANITKQDLLGRSYVEEYLRHKYRRNCKSNTLRQAAISLVQFLSFFASRGNTVLEHPAAQCLCICALFNHGVHRL